MERRKVRVEERRGEEGVHGMKILKGSAMVEVEAPLYIYGH